MTATKCRSKLEGRCPVVDRKVTLSYVRLLTPRADAVLEKHCSEMDKCLADHRSIEQIPKCLLNTLE